MAPRRLVVLVPGELETRSGGYEYDRRIIGGLRDRGWNVSVLSLPGEYPFPTDAARDDARRILTSISDGALVLADGLAYGVLANEVAPHHDRVRFIALVHHPLALETGLSDADAAWLAQSERRALACARKVVVTSPPTIDAVVDLGIQRSRIAVVEPGTDPAPVAEGSAPGAVPCLLCVASLVPRKGHAVLITALAQIADLDWRLVCAGSLDRDPALVTALRQQIEEASLTDRIALVGELDGPELASAYAGADLFVLPTRYEGYGMVVAEALARGIPVVSTPTGAIPALLGADAPAGRLVPPDDAAALAWALRELLSAPAALARLRDAAIRVRAYLPTWAEASRQMAACLESA